MERLCSKDKVIRREMMLREGDLYSETGKEVSEFNVMRLGYFTDATATPATTGRFHTLTNPYRETDTRTPFGFDAYVVPDTRVLDPVVVPSDAIGVAHNVTIVNNVGAGFVTAFAEGGLPGVSTANASGANQLRAASAITRLGSDGQLRYYSMVGTDLVVDVTGWFEGPS